MSKEEKSREKILMAARKEFLEKGFSGASLRRISKEAGVTTGSLYWHFKNKEELFEFIVGGHYDHIIKLYEEGVNRVFGMTPEEQKLFTGDVGKACMLEMLEYMYQYKTEFKILIDGAAGTRYENMIQQLTEAEIHATQRFIRHMRKLGFEGRRIRPELEHILVSSMFSGMLELICHDIPFETAGECAIGLHDYHNAGWMHLLNIPDKDIHAD